MTKASAFESVQTKISVDFAVVGHTVCYQLLIDSNVYAATNECECTEWILYRSTVLRNFRLCNRKAITIKSDTYGLEAIAYS